MLFLKKDHIKKIIEHSKRELPFEACGILAGKESKVRKIYHMTNTDRSEKKFMMEPKEQLRVLKDIRNLKLEMVGIYHSHTYTKAYPSVRDIELAFYPEVSYVIVSLKDIENPDIRSFKIKDEKIVEEELKILNELPK